MPILPWLKLLVVLSPFLTYGVQELRIKWIEARAEITKNFAVADAVMREGEKQEKICKAKVLELENTFKTNAFNTVTVVKEAEQSTAPTPNDKAARQKLCDADPMCRDRRKKK